MRVVSNLRQMENVLLFDVQEIRYIASHRLKCPQPPDWPSIALVTILPQKLCTTSLIDPGLSYIDNLLRHDDVFRTEFLDNIVAVETSETAGKTNQTVHNLARTYGSKLLSLKVSDNSASLVGPGPYLVANGSLWQASRLFNDLQGAFMVGVEPAYEAKANSNTYVPLRVLAPMYQTLSIAVPSRAAGHPIRPLEGMRMAVKDMFDVKGLTTTLCNRALYEISSPATSTAACVEKLIAAGAHLLGTTKTSSMLSREEPTEAVDYPAPFNPRGDGYQSPAGSSSGSAVAVASYEWLDFAIGEDTSGSGRRPAAANGCFEYRPTHESVDLEGMWPTFLRFDTPVILSRDLEKIAAIAPLWCKSIKDEVDPPKPLAILCPKDYLPIENQEHLQCIQSFVEDFQKATGGTVRRFSIEQKWRDSCPEECNKKNIAEYLSNVIVDTFYYSFYHSQQTFRNSYLEKYQKEPYVNSFVKWRWNLGRQVSQEQHQESSHRLEVYKSWFLKEVLRDQDMDSILVMPISEGVPNYRNHPPGTPVIQNGFDPLFLSPILGCPDLVIPIAQTEYYSQISGRIERLPICVNVLGIPGGDARLIDIMQTVLHKSNRPRSVKIGSEIF